jgi:hypothetical protein|tara:strand:- start:12108 stop:12827 length:720 start_codon:yes stop_codon:yes gene_type:complete
MKAQSPIIIRFTVLLAIFVLLGGCGTSPAKEKAVLQGDNRDAVNFSGSWELDYSRSDSAQEKLDGIVRELNRDAQRRAQGNMRQGPGGGLLINATGSNTRSSILGVVRLADEITQSPLLEISQDPHKIRVEREEEFDLTCEFYPGELRQVETPFGTEICGWNGHQLVFKLLLPDGLSIQHVMTGGAAGQKLKIATTVVSSQVSFPFTLNRVFNRFEPGDDGYRCEVTLTRGRVCTTESR